MNQNIKVGNVTITPEMIEIIEKLQSNTSKKDFQNTLDDMMHVLVVITSSEEVSDTMPQISRSFGNVSNFIRDLRDAMPDTH